MANEKRLIDANALIEEVKKNNKKNFYDKDWSSEDVCILLKLAPTVDAVEVVRCKDCKNWKKCESSLIGEAMCCTGQGSVNILKAPTDFCSYGERREGE